jgi:hypothetical protein
MTPAEKQIQRLNRALHRVLGKAEQIRRLKDELEEAVMVEVAPPGHRRRRRAR